ncbi:Uncharacterised protein [Vibrio cholerae]|nr:Uncharacterised protein [Vibrio cholerae]
MVPVRELTIIFAALSAGLNSRFSIAERKATRWLRSRGARTLIEAASTAEAIWGPKNWFTASAKRCAVVKSDSNRLNVM